MKKKIGLIIFSAILLILLGISVIGVILHTEKETILQGQIESIEIEISGTLPGRIEKYYVEEGQHVESGDTLVVISSPQAEAKYNQAKALESASLAQNEKVDAGTRIQLINITKEVWKKAKADLALATHTRERMNKLYDAKVISIQRDGSPVSISFIRRKSSLLSIRNGKSRHANRRQSYFLFDSNGSPKYS